MRRGDRVVCWTETSLRAVEVFAAVARVGAVFAPIAPDLDRAAAIASLSYLRPRLVVASAAVADAAAEIAGELDLLLAVIDGGGAAAPLLDLDAASALASAAAYTDGEPPAESDTHAIFLTSGSTGAPKGVQLSHRVSWLRAHSGTGVRSWPTRDGIVNMFPLHHWAGWSFVLDGWAHHRPVHLVRRAEAEEVLSVVQRWQAAQLYCIPAVWQRILAEPPGRWDERSLRFVDTGTSTVSPALLDGLRARYPGRFLSVRYGSTEAGGVTAICGDELLARPRSVGRVFPCYRAWVDEEGELQVAGELVTSGYFERERETAAVLVDGWYRTGDLTEIDGEGYLRIRGRRAETIRSGGETVAPIEVEAALASYPGLRDVAVVGVRDDDWGELVCAIVVVSDGEPAPSVSQLREHIEGSLAPYKQPRLVVRLPCLPRTAATGQVQRARLRALVGNREGSHTADVL